METYITNLITKITDVLPNLLIAIVILVVTIYLAGWLSKIFAQALTKRKADPEVTHLLSMIIRWSLISLGIISALQRFFDVTAFLAGLGILGFTVGFALQNIMQNFVAGVILLVQQPFNVGDAIEVKGYGGSVLAINLRTTEMRTWDGTIVIIPNGDVLSNTISNYTRADKRRLDVSVGVAYGTNLETAQQTLLDIVKSIPGTLDDPAPSVVTNAFGDSSIGMTLYFWADMKKVGYFDAKDMAYRLVKTSFDKKGIDMPFPIRTVHMQSND